MLAVMDRLARAEWKKEAKCNTCGESLGALVVDSFHHVTWDAYFAQLPL